MRILKHPVFIFLALIFLIRVDVWALHLEYLAHVDLPHEMSFQKTKIGGLSGLFFEAGEGTSGELYSVSDDRGGINEPRFYKFKVGFVKGKLSVTPESVQFIHNKKANLLDMEALAPLPWGNFLVSSEGDNNKKPRVMPEMMDIKKDGTWVRNFPIPDKFLPELTGEQTKGIRNNTAFEGLTSWEPKNLIWAWTEGPLLQDANGDSGPIRILQYEMPEAWVIKPGKEYLYLPESGQTLKQEIIMGAKVSEALAISETDFLVLERTVRLGVKSIGFRCQIYLAHLKGAQDVSALPSLKGRDLSKLKSITKELVLDLDTVKDSLGGSVDNFEGMSFGPMVDGKKTILLVSDDNFKRIQKTQFVLLKLIE
jgi:hypothetical protein